MAVLLWVMVDNMSKMMFLNGLHPTIKAKVISRRLVGLDEIIREARLVEDRNLMILWSINELKSKGPSGFGAWIGISKTKGLNMKK